MPFASGEPTDDPRAVLVKQVRSLAVILREEFGVPFRFYEAGTGVPIDAPASEEKRSSVLLAPAPSLEGPMAIRLVADGRPRVQPLAGGRFQLVMPFPDADRPTTVAVGVLAALARTSGELIQEQARTGKWLRSVHARLCLASQSAGRHRHSPDPEAHSRYGLEALMALEKLLRTQRIDQDPCAEPDAAPPGRRGDPPRPDDALGPPHRGRGLDRRWRRSSPPGMAGSSSAPSARILEGRRPAT